MNSRQIMRAIGELDIVIALAENLRRELDMLYREKLAMEDTEKERVDRLAKLPGPHRRQSLVAPMDGEVAERKGDAEWKSS